MIGAVMRGVTDDKSLAWFIGKYMIGDDRVVGNIFCFFFQAEDGIRDIGVTGVQTCALPIFQDRPASPPRAREPPSRCGVRRPRQLSRDSGSGAPRSRRGRRTTPGAPPRAQIGRASCRERV